MSMVIGVVGANHPVGPFEWAERWGMAAVYATLGALQESYGDSRYRPSPLLRRLALKRRTR